MEGVGRILAATTTAYGFDDRDTINPNAEGRVILMDECKVGMRYRINDTWRARLTWSRVIAAMRMCSC